MAFDDRTRYMHFLGSIGYLIRSATERLGSGDLAEVRRYLNEMADECGAYSNDIVDATKNDLDRATR